MNQNTRNWLHGLLAAFIGGIASAMDSGLALMLIAPDNFNLGPALWKTLITVTVLGILTGIKVMFAYLKQSPLPAESVEIVATQTQTTKVTATPTDDTKG